MAYIEKFLGRKVEIPEDRRYYIKQGLWAHAEGKEITCGMSQPALVLAGGFNSLDWLVPEGQKVRQGDSVVFAITGKVMYIDAPVSGSIHFNDMVKENPSLALEDPYDRGWLFKVKPDSPVPEALSNLASAQDYMESLKTSEGCRNPEGLEGGVSSICKAVYRGIREQKI